MSGAVAGLALLPDRDAAGPTRLGGQMKTFGKRLPVVSLAGILLAVIVYGSGAPAHYSVVAAQATQAANLPPNRPVIRASVIGMTVEGTLGSYCWPQPDSSPQCDFVDQPQV